MTDKNPNNITLKPIQKFYQLEDGGYVSVTRFSENDSDEKPIFEGKVKPVSEQEFNSKLKGGN